MTVDSLGGLRRYLGVSPATAGDSAAALDSLLGTLRSRLVVRGWLDSLDVSGTLEGHDLLARAQRARGVRGTIAVQQLKGRATGSVSLRADTVTAGGIRIEAATLAARLLEKGGALFSATGTAGNGTSLRASGEYAVVADSTDVRLDTLDIAIGKSRWGLLLPMRVRSTPTSLTVDTLLLGAGSARLAGSANIPANAPVRGHLRADGMPLADIGVLAQLTTPIAGRLGFDLDIAGTRAEAHAQPHRRRRLAQGGGPVRRGDARLGALRARSRGDGRDAGARRTLDPRGERRLPGLRHALHGQADRRLAARTHPRRQRGPGAGRGALAQAEECLGPARARPGGER